MNSLIKRLTKRVLGISNQSAAEPQCAKPLENYPDAPDLFHAYRGFAEHPQLSRKPGGWEYRGKFYQDYLTVGGASFAIFRTAQNFCLGQGLDVGAGLWPFPKALSVDIWRGAGAGRTLEDFPEESQDYVFSSHCLEHVEDWNVELDRWAGKVRIGGHLFLYLPHPECGIWNPGSPMVGYEHKWQPEPVVIKDAMGKRGFEVVACDDGPDVMMSFFVCGRKFRK
jgi:hypothetical protein